MTAMLSRRLSVALWAGAILLFRSLVGLEKANTGIDPYNLLTFRVSLLDNRYEKARSRTQFLERVLDQLRSVPSVRGASAAGCVPFTGRCYGTSVNIERRPPAKPGEALCGTVLFRGSGFGCGNRAGTPGRAPRSDGGLADRIAAPDCWQVFEQTAQLEDIILLKARRAISPLDPA